MKKYQILFLLTAAIFVLITILTIKDERAFDGNYFCGFPLAFYTKYSEMVSPSPTSDKDLTRTNYLFLILDIIFAFILAFISFSAYRKLQNIITTKR